MRVQESPNRPGEYVHVPEHRTERVTCGDFSYVGVLYETGQRKVFRSLSDQVGNGGEEEMPAMHEVPEMARNALVKGLERLEELYLQR